MTKLEQWVYSIVISFIISILNTALCYRAEFKEWWIMGFVSFIIGTLLVKSVMFFLEDNL